MVKQALNLVIWILEMAFIVHSIASLISKEAVHCSANDEPKIIHLSSIESPKCFSFIFNSEMEKDQFKKVCEKKAKSFEDQSEKFQRLSKIPFLRKYGNKKSKDFTHSSQFAKYMIQQADLTPAQTSKPLIEKS